MADTKIVVAPTAPARAEAVQATPRVEPAPTHRAYVAEHQIIGEHNGARKVWEKGDPLHLSEAEAVSLGAAVKPS
jgi:hypothetical protein